MGSLPCSTVNRVSLSRFMITETKTDPLTPHPRPHRHLPQWLFRSVSPTSLVSWFSHENHLTLKVSRTTSSDRFVVSHQELYTDKGDGECEVWGVQWDHHRPGSRCTPPVRRLRNDWVGRETGSIHIEEVWMCLECHRYLVRRVVNVFTSDLYSTPTKMDDFW